MQPNNPPSTSNLISPTLPISKLILNSDNFSAVTEENTRKTVPFLLADTNLNPFGESARQEIS